MAVHLRLFRMGSKKRPFYRIVAVDSRTKRDGEYIELIGTHDVLKGETKINEEVSMKWLNMGAIPSDTVKNLFSEKGIMKKFADLKDANKKGKAKPTKKAKVKKPTAKKVVAKPTAKKVEAKPAAKKVEAKPAAKKSTSK